LIEAPNQVALFDSKRGELDSALPMLLNIDTNSVMELDEEVQLALSE